MPIGEFPDFASCQTHMMKEGHTEEEAKKICGKMQADSEGHKDKSKMSAFMAFPQDMVNFTECPRTGDTIFHGVTLMAEGTWTDSLNKKPLTYSADEIARMSFKKTSFKAQHDIYGELPLTNEIGIIEKATLSLNPATWKGDVRIYPTALGKDIATLIKRKQITDISPEFFFEEIREGSKPAGITFMGAATVRKGACRVCTFNEGESEMADAKFSKEHMKEVLADMQSHPDMMDDDMKSMMKGMMNKEMPKGMNEGDTKTMTEGTPPTGGTAANGGATVELSPDQKAQIAMLEQEVQNKQKADSNAFLAEFENMKKENTLLKEQVATLAKRLSNTEFEKRVAELERQTRAISSQPQIHTTITTSRGTHRASAELGSGDFPNYSVRDFGSD